MQLADFQTHADPQGGVEVRQRFVEQEGRRFAHDGAANGDTLALAARQLAGAPVQIVGQVQDRRRGLDPLVLFGLVRPAMRSGKAMFLRTDICG